jgi:hypothetical protein
MVDDGEHGADPIRLVFVLASRVNRELSFPANLSPLGKFLWLAWIKDRTIPKVIRTWSS